ncbi:MAG: Hsp70 family protein [Syntrophomonadaceae bacterium]|nr:Hsp70 family protein [Syntrophomonadaceae bacterium]MDD3897715.1 Hsp70 family protein [Syntrophomonadaceae bacterium]MDD4562131.1 Hsp70 family protein [Syntrophomonadaceae bacterium]
MMKKQEKMSDKTSRPIVGIDLGTTNSAVALWEDGQPRLLASPQGDKIIPSVVMMDLKGRIIVGETARSSLIAMPDRTVAAVKRKMGSERPIALAKEKFLPQEIAALILQELKSYVDNYYGEGEKEAIITVPAYFTDEQRRATKQAGELAGFIVDRIINEPTAAALAFGLQHARENKNILVYDLGGGTFDVSVVEMMDGLLEVLASNGNRMLGGEDFDWMIVDWMAEQIKKGSGLNPVKNIRARALLKEEAEKVKKLLSTKEQVHISLPLVMTKDNRPVGLQADFTRAQFEAMIAQRLQETIDCINLVLQDANLSVQDINDIILVGGSTRIPCVRKLIKDLFNQEPLTNINPDEAVALGAAVQSAIKTGQLSSSELLITDVAPFSMGIAVLTETKKDVFREGAFHVMIKRNTTIPTTHTHRFYTVEPGQDAVLIEIYQGENEWVENNHWLGTFRFEGIPENGEKLEAVDITYRYNLNGILEVTALCVSTGKQMTVSVQDGINRDSPYAFKQSRDRLERLLERTQRAEQNLLLEEEWEPALDLFEEFFEQENGIALDSSPAAIREAAIQMLERTAGMDKTSISNNDQWKLEQMNDCVQAALNGSDTQLLESLLDQLTDLLIDMELEENNNG